MEAPGESLPQLAHALRRTFAYRHGRTLTADSYRATGGIAQAVATTAEAVYASLDGANQQLLRRLTVGLVAVVDGVEDTRRRVNRDDLLGANLEDRRDGEQILGHLVEQRLVTAEDDTYMLSHEALIRAWPRLHDWLTEDRDSVRIQRELTNRARIWDHHGRDAGSLYAGVELELAQRWIEHHPDADPLDRLGSLGRLFLEASIQQEQQQRDAARRRTRRRATLITALAVLLVLAVGAGGLALQQWRGAARERRTAEVQSRIATGRALLVQAESLRGRKPGLAILLGVAALSVDPSAEARSSLVSTLANNHYTGELLGHDAAVRAIAFAPGIDVVATGGNDGKAILWDITRPAHPIRLADLPIDDHPVTALAFSRNGHLIAAVTGGGALAIWNVDTPRDPSTVSIVRDRGEIYTSVAFGQTDRTIVTGGANGGVGVWDQTAGGLRRLTPYAQTDSAADMAVSPDGSMAVVATAGTSDPKGPDVPTKIELWSLRSPGRLRKLATLPPNDSDIASTVFSPDGRTLLLGTTTAAPILFDVTEPTRPQQLGTLSNISDEGYAVAFGPDGRTAVTTDFGGSATLWDVKDKRRPRQEVVLTGHTGPVLATAFSPNGNLVATAGDDHTVLLWAVNQRSSPYELATLGQNRASTLTFSPDSHLAATVGDAATTALWNVSDPHRPQKLSEIPDGSQRREHVVFGPDSRILATDDGDGTVTLWNIRDPRHPMRDAILPRAVTSISFAQNGDLLATGTVDGTAVLWNIADRQHPVRLAVMSGPAVKSDCLRFSPSGRILAACTSLWDVADPVHPKQLGNITNGKYDTEKVEFSPDGLMLAASGPENEATLWNVSDTEHPHREGTLAGHGDFVTSTAWGRSSRLIATSSLDGTFAIWDVNVPAHANRIASMQLPSYDLVYAVTITPDGQTAGVLSNALPVSLWDIKSISDLLDNPAAAACNILGRGLSREEWLTYVATQPYQVTCP